MQEQIELFVDTLLVLIVMSVSFVLMHADPILPLLWGCATFLMTSARKT